MCNHPLQKCLEVIVQMKKQNVVIRGCSSSLSPIYKSFTGKNATFLQVNGCDEKKLENGVFKYCICNKSLCNNTSSAYTINPHNLLLSLCLLINIFYFY